MWCQTEGTHTAPRAAGPLDYRVCLWRGKGRGRAVLSPAAGRWALGPLGFVWGGCGVQVVGGMGILGNVEVAT